MKNGGGASSPASHWASEIKPHAYPEIPGVADPAGLFIVRAVDLAVEVGRHTPVQDIEDVQDQSQLVTRREREDLFQPEVEGDIRRQPLRPPGRQEDPGEPAISLTWT